MWALHGISMHSPPIQHNVNVIYAIRLLYPAVTSPTDISHIHSCTFHLSMSPSAINNVSKSVNIVKNEKKKKYNDSSLWRYYTKSSSLELLDPEHEGTMISQNIGNYLPVNMA